MKAQFISTILFACALCGCIQKASEKATHYYQQSTTAAEQGNISQALASIDQALAHNPLPLYKAHKATLLYQENSVEESLSLFEELVNDSSVPAHVRADILNNYACVLHMRGNAEGARAIWQQLTNNHGYRTPEVAYYNLGLIALHDENLTTAEEYLTQATELAPDYVDALLYLAQAQQKQKKNLHAQESLTHLLAIAPHHPIAQQMMTDVKSHII